MMRSVSLVAIMTILVAHVAACQRSEPDAPSPAPTVKAAPASAPPAVQTETAATGDSSTVASHDRAPSLDFSVPRTAAVVGKNGELSFTIAEATIEPRNPESIRLVLLVRMHNKQRQEAKFADENFRLMTQDSEIPANGGLGETIDAGSDSTLERVQFIVPFGAVARALKIEYGGEATELPLGLKW